MHIKIKIILFNWANVKNIYNTNIVNLFVVFVYLQKKYLLTIF